MDKGNNVASSPSPPLNDVGRIPEVELVPSALEESNHCVETETSSALGLSGDEINSENAAVDSSRGLFDRKAGITTQLVLVEDAATADDAQADDTVEVALPTPELPKSQPLGEVTASRPSSSTGKTVNNPHVSRPQSPALSSTSASSAGAHKRSMTISRGHNVNVSVVLISSALDTIASSKEAKRSTPLRESTQRALELIRSNQGGDRPREIFEPLRLACETKNEKLTVASLDCISKLISYSFFAEDHTDYAHSIPSPPPSPHPSGRRTSTTGSHSSIPQPSLVDLVAHTITSCHTETTPDPVSLQIVKALLSLVLSPTIIVHHSSLLKAVRTVYNVFLLSSDPVNQMVAQGGLTQMVHHVFTRCTQGSVIKSPSSDSNVPLNNEDILHVSNPVSLALSQPESTPQPQSNGNSDGVNNLSKTGTSQEPPPFVDLPIGEESERNADKAHSTL